MDMLANKMVWINPIFLFTIENPVFAQNKYSAKQIIYTI